MMPNFGAKRRFEMWFLALDRDFDEDDLCTVGGGQYFYTTTKYLFLQFCQIEKLEAELEGRDDTLCVLDEKEIPNE